MTIVLIENARANDGAILTAGSTVTLSDAEESALIGAGRARAAVQKNQGRVPVEAEFNNLTGGLELKAGEIVIGEAVEIPGPNNLAAEIPA